MTDTEFHLPPPPDPNAVAQWTGQIRALIALASGLGLGGAWLGHVTDQQISSNLTAIMTVMGLLAYLGSAIWSWIEKMRLAAAARKVAVASAVASARATEITGVATPLTVSVVKTTPAGQPDIGEASRVSAAEVATAPVVPTGQIPTVAPPAP